MVLGAAEDKQRKSVKCRCI